MDEQNQVAQEVAKPGIELVAVHDVEFDGVQYRANDTLPAMGMERARWLMSVGAAKSASEVERGTEGVTESPEPTATTASPKEGTKDEQDTATPAPTRGTRR